MKNSEDFLEIYKITVEMSDRLSARRGTTNTFFISIQSALLASTGLWVNFGIGLSLKKAIFLALISLVLSIIWWLQIQTYRNLSKAKFDVIHEIEGKLAYAPYVREWEIVQGIRRKHIDLTRTEGLIPGLFLILNLIFVISAI